ncbi:MAG: Cof-type HAD-IIB family hydrolase [Lachnospiraceae bacterium]|nr:Cof-type HAD-IIB family hydrolase [Lachnospiraceae bacterium]
MSTDRKILFTDLDETLLTTDKKICSENVKAIRKMVEAGHIFAINTGRPYNAAAKLTKDLNLGKNCYILSFHGTNVYDCYQNKVINANYLHTEKAIKILKDIDKEGIHSQTFTFDGIYTTCDDDIMVEYNKYTFEPVNFVNDYDEIKEKKLYKVMAIDFNDHDRLDAFQNKYIDETQTDFNTFFSCPEYLEYTLKGADKGDGVKFLAGHLGISIDNTVAVGDEGNDMPMIKAAGVGVCMNNGFFKVKDIADYVTENDNNNGGIAEVIHKFIL